LRADRETDAQTDGRLGGKRDMMKLIIGFRNFCETRRIILRFIHSVLLSVFIWISEQTAILSLYSINWLVFITEMESVYYAVRTDSLNIIQFNFF
jgi:hypothetical protein